MQYFASNAYIKPNARCPVLCKVHTQSWQRILQPSRKLENYILTSSPVGWAQQAWCEWTRAHFKPCAAHWQNIAVKWTCSLNMHLSSIMLPFSTYHHVKSRVTWYICVMQDIHMPVQFLGPSSLLHPRERPHAIQRAAWSHMGHRVSKCQYFDKKSTFSYIRST